MKTIQNFDNFNKINETLSRIPVDPSDDNNNDKQILRAAIIAEFDAINLYEQMAANVKDKDIKKVLLDIAKEEKTHVGEFEALLKNFDKEHEKELENGEDEVKELK